MTIPEIYYKMMKFIDEHFIAILIAWVVIGCVLAVGVHAQPTTLPATMVGSNNATLSATGASGSNGWFIWGQLPGDEYWKTSNVTITGGTFSYTIARSPLYGNTLFYFAACDDTGCGNEQSFTTLPVTPLPQTDLGKFYRNITEQGYDIPSIAANIVDPYIWTGTPITIVFMLIFSPIFIGVWLRSRTVLVALILGFVTGSFILYSNSGLMLGMPAEIVSLAQAICYVSFAGMILYIAKR